MEGNRKDREIEKGGYCETMKKDVGGRTGRESKCVLAKREKTYRKIALNWSREGKDRRVGTQGCEINASLQYHITTKLLPFVF